MSSCIFAGFALFLYLAIAVILIQKYRRTHDAGLVWLGIAVVAWPLVSNLFGHGERAAIDWFIKRQPVGFYPFTLVERGVTTLGGLVYGLAVGQRLIGLVLLLVAVWNLRSANGRGRVLS